MSDGTDAVDVARLEFEVLGVPFPPVPAPFVADFGWVAEQIYGTREDRPNPYDLVRYVEEVTAASPADYVLVGRDGHGINSQAMHYYCVEGPLALFVQLGFGGAYTPGGNKERITSVFAAAADLRTAVATARAHGRLAPDERLLVVQSDFHGARWRRLDAGDTDIRWRDTEKWRLVEDAIAAARSSLGMAPTLSAL